MNIKNLLPLFVFILSFSIGKVTSYIEYDGWVNVELLHAVNAEKPEIWTHRANITIPSLSSGLSNIIQKALSKEDLDNIKSIAVRNGFYRLKAIVEYPNGSLRTFTTANKACSILSVQLNDEIWIAIDGNGHVNGINLSTTGSEINDCSVFDFSSFVANEFTTEILIKHTELAPVPDTASFIQKIEREREARDRGEVKDNRGFLAKYWIYIVPVVILLFVSGAANPDQQK